MAREISSIGRFGLTEPFDFQVGRGQIAYHSLVNIQGYNIRHHTTFRAVWELSETTDYVFPTTATAMIFASTLAETCTMQVSGVDANYVLKTATVTFTAGTIGVVTSGTSTFFRINYMQVTLGTTVGTVTAKNGGGTVYAQIDPAMGRSQASIYTVPYGHTFYLTRAQAFTASTGSQTATYRVYSQTITGGVTTPNTVLSAPFQSLYASTRVVARGYPEKTDIQWQLAMSVDNPGSIQVEGILINNLPTAP